MEQVAQLLGTTYGAVHYHLVRTGTPRRPQGKTLRPWNKRDWPMDTIMEMYASGQSTYAIAKKFNTAGPTIARLLNDAGVAMRQQRDYPSQITGARNCNWRGGRRITEEGYIDVRVSDSNGSRYEREHRLVMERTLGRRLKPTEHVHHLNGIRTDNRPDNLAVMNKASHHRLGPTLQRTMQARIRHLESLLGKGPRLPLGPDNSSVSKASEP